MLGSGCRQNEAQGSQKKRPGDPRGGVLEAKAPHKSPTLIPICRRRKSAPRRGGVLEARAFTREPPGPDKMPSCNQMGARGLFLVSHRLQRAKMAAWLTQRGGCHQSRLQKATQSTRKASRSKWAARQHHACSPAPMFCSQVAAEWSKQRRSSDDGPAVEISALR